MIDPNPKPQQAQPPLVTLAQCDQRLTELTPRLVAREPWDRRTPRRIDDALDARLGIMLALG